EEIAIEGISKGVFHENLDVKILRMFIFGGIRHLLHTWAHDPQSISLSAVRESVKFFVKKGMLN
ncbi:MAG: TetR/AcrR family transcriptional regulator C-terminal domain-containing protein, partial [Syntrophothermus sp.]